MKEKESFSDKKTPWPPLLPWLCPLWALPCCSFDYPTVNLCQAPSINNLDLIGSTIPQSVEKEAREHSPLLCLIGKQMEREREGIPYQVYLNPKLLQNEQARFSGHKDRHICPCGMNTHHQILSLFSFSGVADRSFQYHFHCPPPILLFFNLWQNFI